MIISLQIYANNVLNVESFFDKTSNNSQKMIILRIFSHQIVKKQEILILILKHSKLKNYIKDNQSNNYVLLLNKVAYFFGPLYLLRSIATTG